MSEYTNGQSNVTLEDNEGMKSGWLRVGGIDLFDHQGQLTKKAKLAGWREVKPNEGNND